MSGVVGLRLVLRQGAEGTAVAGGREVNDQPRGRGQRGDLTGRGGDTRTSPLSTGVVELVRPAGTGDPCRAQARSLDGRRE